MLDLIKKIVLLLPSTAVVLTAVVAVVLGLIGRKRREPLSRRVSAWQGKYFAVRENGCRWWQIVLVALSWLALVGVLFGILRVSVWETAKFLLFFAFYVVLPGYWAVRGIRKVQTASALFALSSLMGMCLLVGVYILASFVKVLWLISVVSPVLGAVSLLLFVRDLRGGRYEKRFFQLDWSLLTAFSLILAYSMIVRASYAASPELTGSTSYFMDSLYIISNSSAMTGGLFADSLNFPGFLLRYHAITNVLQACAIRVTGIPAVNIFMQFWPLLYVSSAVTAMHGLIAEYRGNRSYASIATFLTIVSGIFTLALLHLFQIGAISNNLYKGTGNLLVYLLALPNGIDIAIPAIFGAAYVGLKYYRGTCGKWTAFGAMAALAALATGAKTPFGACLCGALAGTVLIAALQKQGFVRLKKPACLLLASVLGFALIYVVMIYNPSPTASNTMSIFQFSDQRSSLMFEYTHDWLVCFLRAHGMGALASNTGLILLILFPVSLIGLAVFTMPAFLTWTVSQLRKFRSITLENMLLCGIVICGVVAYYLISFDGYSQCYFALAAVPFVNILGFYWLVDHYKTLKYPVKAIFALLLACSLFFTEHQIISQMTGALHTTQQIISTDSEEKAKMDPSYESLTKAEYEGMIWLRENTPKNTLVAIDRFFTSEPTSNEPLDSIDKALYYYYVAYSERHMFLSGYAYSIRTVEMTEWLENQLDIQERLYDSDTENRVELMRDNGISYLVVSRFVSDDLRFQDNNLVEVFHNQDITIYADVNCACFR